jgi:hypothetical protein
MPASFRVVTAKHKRLNNMDVLADKNNSVEYKFGTVQQTTLLVAQW